MDEDDQKDTFSLEATLGTSVPLGKVINLIDPDDGRTFTVILSAEDSTRIENDTAFAQQLLKNIRNNANNESSASATVTVSEKKSSGSQNDPHFNWSFDATLQLIRSFDARFGDWNDSKKRKQLYNVIAKDLTKNGHECTPYQVQNKWKGLLRSYEHNKPNKGRNKKRQHSTCRFYFYDEMDKVLKRHEGQINFDTNSCDPTSLDDGESSDEDIKPAKKILLGQFEAVDVTSPHHQFTFDATSALLDSIEPYAGDLHMLEDAKHKKHIFKEITENLKSLGHIYDRRQVQIKWQSLVRSFKNTQENRKWGSTSKCMHYDHMNQLFGNQLQEIDTDRDPDYVASSESSDNDEDPFNIPTYSAATSQSFVWNYKSTLALIKMMKHVEANGGNKKGPQIYEQAAADLNRQGYKCTSGHVRSKWSNLVRSYRGVKEQSNGGSGRAAAKFIFYKEMDSLFSDDKKNVKTEDNDENDGKKGPDHLKFLKERERNRQQRHTERMEMEKRRIAVMEKILAKLDASSAAAEF